MKPFVKISILIWSIVLLTLSCKKSDSTSSETDKTNPVISLIGDSDLSIALGGNTSDPGATANDNIDGDISTSISSDWNTAVDQSKTGSYVVNYTVSDKAGNKGTAKRNVTVKSMASSYLGVYKSILSTSFGSSSQQDATITLGNSPTQLKIFPFYIGYTLHADLVGLLNNEIVFDWNDQSANFKGTGTITNGGKNITLIGNITTTSGSQTFTSTLTKN